MTISTLLDACARAFAMVSYSDGNLAETEAQRFASFVAAETELNAPAEADVRASWAQAVNDVQTAASFGGALVRIRSEVSSPEEKAVVMRAGQAALIADQKLELQENVAIRSLAEALGLDPDSY